MNPTIPPIFPTLYKPTATGAVEEWMISVIGSEQEATIIVSHGLVGCKKQHVTTRITEGKNHNRANYTTPLQQAVKEAKAEWTKKRERKHYGLSVEESTGKQIEAPMLAQTYPRSNIDWTHAYAQPKLDGNRCLARCTDGLITLWSRQAKPIVLPHILDALRSVMKDGDVFDGELYLHGKPLNEIRSLIARPRTESEQLTYQVYDTVAPVSFQERHDLLTNRIKRNGDVALVTTTRIGDEATLMQFQADCIEVGFEGAMLRHGLAAYEPGKRSASLLKVKSFTEAEFPILRVREGAGTHKGMAIYTCLCQANEFDVTAPGTHAEKKEQWTNRHYYVGKLLTVKYQALTATDHPVPFLPVAIAVREGD